MLSIKEVSERPGFLPGFLSFCLPGLGQLYQRRFPVAAAGFLPFWAFLALMPGHAWPLLLAVGFGAEAFRWGTLHPPAEVSSVVFKRRRTAYTATGIIGFCFWAMLVSPAALPLQRQAMANAAADRLAAFYRNCAREIGRKPSSAADCAALGEPKAPDPWGRAFHYLATERGFELRSAGADGKATTQDDFVYQYRFR